MVQIVLNASLLVLLVTINIICVQAVYLIITSIKENVLILVKSGIISIHKIFVPNV
jgi:hypothetical protein